MSRVLLVALGEGQVVKACEVEHVLISTIEPLLSGGVRLVCQSVAGAARMTVKLKPHLIKGAVVRERHRPTRPLW